MIRTVGNYKLLQELGEGAMGTVYRALDMQLEREVALKSLRPELARRPDIVDRFREEAKLQGKLENIHIVRLYQFLREGSEFFMVMEFVKGKTLSEILRQRQRLPPNEAVTIMEQALAGLGYAHKRNIVHRDIKPANIMINEDDTVKVADFGIARLVGSARQTKLGSIVGTLEYISPEAVQGNDATAVSDIYSCGILLFELLSGRLPFESPNEYELARAHVKDKPPSLRQFAPETPTRLEKAVMRALAKKPGDRFQSAAQMAQELKQCVAGGSGEAQPERSFWNKLWSSSTPAEPEDTQIIAGLQLSTPDPRRQSPLLEADDTSQRLRNTALQDLSRQVDDYLNQRNWSRARQEVEKMTALYPREPALVEMSNRIAREERHYGESLQMALREARNLLDRGLPEAAKKAIELSLQRFPSEPDLSALAIRADAELAVLAARSSEVVEVVERVDQLLKDGRHPEAIASAAEAVARFPNQPDVTALLSRAVKAQKVEGCRQQVDGLRKTSQWDAALTAIDQTLALYREEPLLVELRHAVIEERECERQSNEAQATLTRAAELRDQGQPDAAERALDGAIVRLTKAGAPVVARLIEASEALKNARYEKIAASAIEEARALEGRLEWQRALDVLDNAVPKAPGVTALQKTRTEIEQARARHIAEVRNALAEGRALLDANRFEDALVSISASARKYPGETGFTELLLEAQQKLTLERRERQLNAARTKAGELLASQAFEEAEQFLLDATSQFPGEARFTDLLSSAIQGRREQEKKRTVERAISSAKHYAAGKLYDDGIRALDEALAVYPAEPALEAEKRELTAARYEARRVERVRELREWIAAGKKDFDAARASADAALAEYPGDAELTAVRGEIETAHRAFDRSNAERETAVRSAEMEARGQYTEALSLADAQLSKFPESEAIAALKQDILARRDQAERSRRVSEAEQRVRRLLASEDPHQAIEPMKAALDEFPGQETLATLNEEVAARIHELDAEAAARLVRDSLGRRDWSSAQRVVRDFEGIYGSDATSAALTKDIAQARQARKKSLDETADQIRMRIAAGEFVEAIGAIDQLGLSEQESQAFNELRSRAQAGLQSQLFQKRFQELRDRVTGALDRGEIEAAVMTVVDARTEFDQYPAFLELESKVDRERAISAALDHALDLVGTREWAQAVEYLDSKIEEFGKDRRFLDLIAQIEEERKTRHKAAEAALGEARAAFDAGRPDSGIERLTRAIAEFPDEPALADELEKMRQELAAITLETRHKAAEAALADARAMFKSGQHQPAIERLTSAVAEFPDEPALADALQKLRDEHAVILRAARHKAAEAALADARTLFAKGQHDKAIQQLAAAVAEYTDEPALADALQKLRDEHAVILRAARHTAAEAALADARTLFAKGQHDKAIQQLAAAVAEYTEEPALTDALKKLRDDRAVILRETRHKAAETALAQAQALFSAGQHDKAIQQLSAAVAEYSEEPALAQALEKLRDDRAAILREGRHKAAEAALAEAQTLFAAGQHDQAIQQLADAAAEYSEEPALADALRKFRDDRMLLARKAKVREVEDRARSLLTANKSAAAEVLLERALDDFKGEASLEKLLAEARTARHRAEEVKTCVDTVQAWLTNGKPAQAEAALLDALRRFPKERALAGLKTAVAEALIQEAVAAAHRQLAAGRIADAKALHAAATEKHGQGPKLGALAKEIEDAEQKKATVERAIAVAASHLDSGRVQEALAIVDKLPAWVAADSATVEFRERCQRMLAWQKVEFQQLSARADALGQQGLFEEAAALLESASADAQLQPLLLPLLDRYRNLQLSATQQLANVRQMRAQSGPSAALEAIRQTEAQTLRHPDFERLRDHYEKELREQAAPTRLTPIPTAPTSTLDAAATAHQTVVKPTVIAPALTSTPAAAAPVRRTFPPAALWGGIAVVVIVAGLLVKSILAPTPAHPTSAAPAVATSPSTTPERAPEAPSKPTGKAEPQIVGNLAPVPRQILVDYQVGNPFPQPYKINIANASGPISFTAVVSSGAEWLSVTPDRSTTPASITATLKLSGLKVGSHEGAIRVTPSTGRSATIAVNLTIHPFSIR